MYVSAKLDYAMRALAALPSPSGDQPKTVPQLAEDQGVSVVYLRTTMNDLRVAGLVVHERGPQGGYRLARRRSEISMRDVVAAVRILPVEVHQSSRSMDDVGRRLSEVWQRVEDATLEVLGSVSVADVAQETKQVIEAV
jgi:Rrf2 family protein